MMTAEQIKFNDEKIRKAALALLAVNVIEEKMNALVSPQAQRKCPRGEEEPPKKKQRDIIEGVLPGARAAQ